MRFTNLDSLRAPRGPVDITRTAFWAIARTAGLFCICLGLSYWVLRSAHAGESGRQKVIDFEESVVEGVNKRPLDSFNQISEAEKRKRRLHLYRKRASFHTETLQTLDQMRFEP